MGTSSGKLLSEAALHGFTLHPRDFLRELIEQCKKARNAEPDVEGAEEWQRLSDALIVAYNKAPSRR